MKMKWMKKNRNSKQMKPEDIVYKEAHWPLSFFIQIQMP